jgi:putative endonuclease
VFVETAADARTAIAREKQIKNWRREKKLALIQAKNPAWDDLSAYPS